VRTLNIQTSRPTLSITTTNAQLNISNKIRRFSSRRVPPEMKIERKAPSFKVDWRKVWSQSGKKSPEDLALHVRQQARQRVDQYIQKVATNGDYILQVKNYVGTKSDPLAELRWQEMMSQKPEVNVTSMPETTPDVVWDLGYVKIEWTTGEVQIDWDDEFMPEITVSPHSVEIRIEGRKEIKISLNEDNVPKIRGKKVNKKV